LTAPSDNGQTLGGCVFEWLVARGEGRVGPGRKARPRGRLRARFPFHPSSLRLSSSKTAPAPTRPSTKLTTTKATTHPPAHPTPPHTSALAHPPYARFDS